MTILTAAILAALGCRAPVAAQEAPPEAAPATAPVRALTLAEAYAAALARSERLAQDREAVREHLARVDELWSAVKPRVALFGTETLQDTPRDSGGITNSFAQRSRPQAGFNLRQPLFSGLRELLAVRAARAETESARLDARRAEQRLYQDVAAAYLELLSVRRELATRAEIIELTGGRIEELRSRARIGRSRKSEVLAAESQLSQVESDAAAARGRERVAQSALRFITGLEAELAPAEVSVEAPGSLAAFLERAAARPDVEARRREAEAAELGVELQRRLSWPTLGADANYYLKRPAGFLRDIRWDATFSASLP
ncbi:MAG: TolC family protein, partial [Elusimicrobia bacterium]|nr:TolC family protein [Elusimicrobiota bacterium]